MTKAIEPTGQYLIKATSRGDDVGINWVTDKDDTTGTAGRTMHLMNAIAFTNRKAREVAGFMRRKYPGWRFDVINLSSMVGKP